MLAGGSYSNSVHYNPLSQPNNRTYSKRIRLAAKRFFQFSWFSEDCPGDLKKLSLAGFSAYKSFKSIDYEAKKVKTCLAKPPPSTFSPLSFIKSLFNIIFLVITLALSSSSFLFCQSGIKVYFDTANSIKSPIGINTWKTGSFTLKTSDYDALRNKFRLDTFSYKQEYRFYEGEENKIPISGDFDNEKLNKWDAELDKQNKSITFRKDKDRIVIKDGENVKRYVDGEMDSSASNEYRAKIEIFPKTQGNDGYNPVGVEFLKLDSVMIVGDTIFTVGKEHYAVFSTPDSEANYVFVMASILPSYEKNYYTGEDTLFPHSVKMYEKYGREGKMRLMNSIGQTLAPETIKFLFAEREGHVHSWFKNYSDEGYKKAIAWDRIKLKKSTYDWYDMKAYVIYNKPVRFSFSVSDSLYFSISFLGVNMEQNSMRYAHPDTTFKISRGGVWFGPRGPPYPEPTYVWKPNIHYKDVRIHLTALDTLNIQIGIPEDYTYMNWGAREKQTPSSIKEIKKNTLTISPNPVIEQLNICYKNLDIEYPYTPKDISIYNILGECVLLSSHIENDLRSFSVNVSGLPAGVYILRYGSEAHLFIKD